MSDETTPVVTADLKLVLRNADRAARNAAAAFEASERLVTGIGARFDAVESRLTGWSCGCRPSKEALTALLGRITASSRC
jgi:hypothetical protein